MERSAWAGVLWFVIGLGGSAGAGATGGTATDQGAALQYPAIHWSDQPASDLAGVDVGGDPLYRSGWWYRADGDTRELPFPPPDSESYVDGTVVATWNNLHGKGFQVTEKTRVYDQEGPSGGFVSSLVVVNGAGVTRQFTAFHYVDGDAGGTFENDTATLAAPGLIRFLDTVNGRGFTYRAPAAQHYQVGFPGGPSSVVNALNDAALTTLGDSGLPFGPGDATAGFQFGAVSLPPGGAAVAGQVGAFFNAPRLHVKGDLLGLGLPASLYSQATPAAGSAIASWMRRTTQTGDGLGFGLPTASCALAGVDDFDGNLRDEAVTRDTVSGVAYVGGTPIGGAATLPLNWKLAATGDFNGDGRADLLWRNTTSQKLVVWTMNGAAKVGNVIPSPDQAVDANWEVAAAADFNGDGARDLLWYNQTSGRIVLWFMNAALVRLAGQFTNPASVGDNNWRTVAVGDYGRGPGGLYDTQDVVWQNDTSRKVVVWFMDLAGNRTGGTFTTPDTVELGSLVVGPR